MTTNDDSVRPFRRMQGETHNKGWEVERAKLREENQRLLRVVAEQQAALMSGAYKKVPVDVKLALTTPTGRWQRIVAEVAGVRCVLVLRPRVTLEPVAVPGAWQVIEQTIEQVQMRSAGEHYFERLQLPEPVGIVAWWADDRESRGVVVAHADLSKQARREAHAVMLKRQPKPQSVALAPAAMALAAVGVFAALRRWAASSARSVPGTVGMAVSAATTGTAAITFALAPTVVPGLVPGIGPGVQHTAISPGQTRPAADSNHDATPRRAHPRATPAPEPKRPVEVRTAPSPSTSSSTLGVPTAPSTTPAVASTPTVTPESPSGSPTGSPTASPTGDDSAENGGGSTVCGN